MKRISVLLTIAILLAFPFTMALAQGETPPVDPNSVWGEVVDQDGNIRYDNLTDLGTVQETVDWMPSIPGIGNVPATYHEYQTPTGNVVVLPTASTLFFMALNPEESGLGGADSQLGMGAGMALEAPGIIQGMLQGYIDPSTIASLGYTSQDQFFSDVIDGKQNIWSVLGDHTIDFLWSLANASLTDQSIYTMILLYTPGSCDHIPGGCPENAKLPDLPPAPSCTTPVVTRGAITVTASLIAPPFPLVIGQDDSKRGADVTWEVRVAPTTYTYGVEVPVLGTQCVPWSSGSGTSNCQIPSTDSNGITHYQPGILQQVVVGYNCEKRTDIYPESLNWVTFTVSLSEESRDWILNILSIRYPEAYLHHPTFNFAGFLGSGGFQGDTYVWTLTQNQVQVADPGNFDLIVAGATSGTPVSQSRGFSRVGGEFAVWLKETAIIK